MSKLVSVNFAFLEPYNPQLVKLGALAERYFADDPNTCLIKLRQFGECLAQLVAAHVGMSVDGQLFRRGDKCKFVHSITREKIDF